MKITFPALLGLLFIGLKLGHVIAWSWWLVLLPLYAVPAASLAVVVAAVALTFGVVVLAAAVSAAGSAGDLRRGGVGRLRTK